MVIVVMGVSGVGKTTVGHLLARRLDAAFLEGDDFHPEANVEKMRRGIPLDDDDRRPWLLTLRQQIDRWLAEGRPGVLACSALKRAYREILGAGQPDIHFVYLRGNEEQIRGRLELRSGHYMPPTLLPSQIAALEEPEDAIVADVSGTPEEIAAQVVAALEVARHPGR